VWGQKSLAYLITAVATDRAGETLQRVWMACPLPSSNVAKGTAGRITTARAIRWHPASRAGKSRRHACRTYAVGANNTELRCCMSQLAKRTWAFAKRVESLKHALACFVQYWRARQMLRQHYPAYSRGLSDFVSLRV
jgi:IS1 family transposase